MKMSAGMLMPTHLGLEQQRAEEMVAKFTALGIAIPKHYLPEQAGAAPPPFEARDEDGAALAAAP